MQRETSVTTGAMHPEIQQFLEKRDSIPEKIPLESLQRLFPELLTILREISTLTAKWNMVEISTPPLEEISEAKKQMLQAYDQGQPYNPVFTYPRAVELYPTALETKKRLQELLTTIRTLSVTERYDRLARVAIYAKIKDDLASCDYIEGLVKRNDTQVRDALTQKYRSPHDALALEYETTVFSEAIERKRGNGEKLKPKLSPNQLRLLEKTHVSAEQAQKLFEQMLAHYDLLGATDQTFQVSVDAGAQSMDARHKSKDGSVIALKTAGGTAKRMIALLAHEIRGHARQIGNQSKLLGQPLGLAYDEETLYEGLGVRNEDKFTQKHYGEAFDDDPLVYTYALQLATQGKSFSEVYSALVDRYLHFEAAVPLNEPLPQKVTPEQLKKAKATAWSTTYRIFRGHTDTTNEAEFGFDKEIAYSLGMLLQRQLEEVGLEYINDVGVIPPKGLAFLAEFDINPEDVPHPNDNFEEVILQQVLAKAEQRQKTRNMLGVAAFAGAAFGLLALYRQLRKK